MTDPIDPARLEADELEWLRAEALATAQPWAFWDNSDNQFVVAGDEKAGKYICALAGFSAHTDDFRFIAIARTAVPELLRRLSAERAKVGELRPHADEIEAARQWNKTCVGLHKSQEVHTFMCTIAWAVLRASEVAP